MSDDEWTQYRSWADRVSIVVTPIEDQLKADDPDEFWLIESHGAAWDQDWLLREVYQIAAPESEHEVVPPAPHWLEVHEKHYSWGADSAAIEILLFLSQWAATSAAWDAAKTLAFKMQKRLSAERERGSDFPLEDDDLERAARRALSSRYGTERESAMILSSIEIEPPSSASATFRSPDGWMFEAEIAIVGDDVTIVRVKRSRS